MSDPKSQQGLSQRPPIVDRPLLWLTSAWHYLRPVLISLYRVLHHIPTTMVGMEQFLFGPSPRLTLTQDLTHKHQSLAQHVTLVRVANSHVRTLDEVQKMHLKSRRVWIGITDPSSPPDVGCGSPRSSSGVVKAVGVYAFFPVDVTSEAFRSYSYSGCYGQPIAGKFGRCSLLCQWAGCVVSIPNHPGIGPVNTLRPGNSWLNLL